MITKKSSNVFSRMFGRALGSLGFVQKSDYKAISLVGNGNIIHPSAKLGVPKPGNVSFAALRKIAKYDALIGICVNAIKKEVSQSDWQIVKKAKIRKWTAELEAKAEEGIEKFTHILDNMNANGETFRTMLDRVLEDLLILDAGVLEILRDNKGEFIGLNSVDGATIRPVYNQFGEFGEFAYKQIVSEKEVASFYADEIIYMMQHPQNDIYTFGYGLSPIERILLAVQASLQADMFNVRAFSEDNVPPGMIDLGEMGTEEAQQFISLWDATVVGHTQKMKFVWGGTGNKKYQPFANKQKDMQYIEYLDWLSRLKLASYGLTSGDANITQDVNRATAQVQKSVSKSRGVRTMKHLFEETLTRALITAEGYDMIEFKFFAPQDLDDEKKQADIDKTRVDAGIVTPDEIRERDGLPPLEDMALEEDEDEVDDPLKDLGEGGSKKNKSFNPSPYAGK